MSAPTSAAEKLYTLPLVVAVTGHRDLIEAELDGIRDEVRDFFTRLRRDFPYNRLTVLSPLAEGADQLVAEVAYELDLDVIVPMPKPMDDYLNDFADDDAKAHFQKLCSQATDVFELDSSVPATPEGFSDKKWQSAFPYAQLGIYLAGHCHILLALWDGKDSDQLGGTAQVVKFHHDDVMPGMTEANRSSQQLLIDDESDLVYHIVCSRKRDRSGPAPGLQPQQCSWFTKDEEHPRARELPAQHELIFSRTSEFSADAIQHSAQIRENGWHLFNEADRERLPEHIEAIDRLYVIADWLAMHYQQKTSRVLLVSHLSGFFMGLMFILFSDLATLRLFLMLFLLSFAAGVTSQILARKGAWHRKYLDYRALAEGLRVQYYWAAAGVSNENKWKFTHDDFLQSQNPEIGWIRNVMRVAGLRCDAHPNQAEAGLRYTQEQWVGGNGDGQLDYFRRKTAEKVGRHEATNLLGRISLGVSVVTVLAFLALGEQAGELLEMILIIVMGTTLLAYAVREGYTFATGTRELIKQYQFMLQIFEDAHRRLQNASSPQERRQVLAALGQAALDEHSDWILMNRERSVDQGEIWKIGK